MAFCTSHSSNFSPLSSDGRSNFNGNDVSTMSCDARLTMPLSTSMRSILGEQLDVLAHHSARAQNLRGPITSWKQCCQKQQPLHIVISNGILLGYLKTGRKRLFIAHRMQHNGLIEKEFLCVLDFYVEEKVQRRGLGRKLFMEMMQYYEGIQPCMLAYDRPSTKLRAFMRKHFNLYAFEQQANHFVVFDDYFNEQKTEKDRTSTVSQNISADSKKEEVNLEPVGLNTTVSNPADVDLLSQLLTGQVQTSSSTTQNRGTAIFRQSPRCNKFSGMHALNSNAINTAKNMLYLQHHNQQRKLSTTNNLISAIATNADENSSSNMLKIPSGRISEHTDSNKICKNSVGNQKLPSISTRSHPAFRIGASMNAQNLAPRPSRLIHSNFWILP